ncbi:hypothetical protein XNA1_2470008 [Xenorhabdus nematophila str. Anatoliense]|nr:hypothetical protein XNA1_2470008 [Xenorhabdus nematophila str. Anatoliense]
MKKYFFIIGFLFVSGCVDFYKNHKFNEAKELYATYVMRVKNHCDLYLLNMNSSSSFSDKLYVLNGYRCPDGKIYFVNEEFAKNTIPVF